MTAWILNLFDLVFTLAAISRGEREANTITAAMLELHPVVYLIYKIFVVGALLWWLSKRQERLARFGMKALAAVFAAVDLWHIVNIFVWRFY